MLPRSAALALVATLVFAMPARAEILDQSFEAFSSPPNGHIVSNIQWVAQSFTVGIEGTLTRVEVEIARNTVAPSADLLLEIRRVLPGGGGFEPGAFATAAIPAASVPTSFSFHPVDLSAAGVAVKPGDVLAIALQTSAPAGGGLNPYAWELDSGYPGGGSFIARPTFGQDYTPNPPVDYGFRTFVQPIPEPSGAVLLGVGAMALIVTRRWRKRASSAGPQPKTKP
jgi:hypothetical protein